MLFSNLLLVSAYLSIWTFFTSRAECTRDTCSQQRMLWLSVLSFFLLCPNTLLDLI